MKNIKINNEKPVFDLLDSLDIEYRLLRHDPVFTADDAASVLAPDELGLKTLILRNRAGDAFFVVALPDNERADIKSLEKITNTDKLIFATEDNLREYFAIAAGSVSPFVCLSADNAPGYKLLISKKILNAQQIAVHPNNNVFTVILSKSDFLSVLDVICEDYIVF